MPYIKKEDRVRVYDLLKGPDNAGELNFAITTLIVEYLFYREGRRLNYQSINDCLGALEGAKLEFYRRIVSPYEEGKIITNGDVYDPDV